MTTKKEKIERIKSVNTKALPELKTLFIETKSYKDPEQIVSCKCKWNQMIGKCLHLAKYAFLPGLYRGNKWVLNWF